MAEPVLEKKSGVGPLDWWVTQGAYIHAKCRTIEIAQAALEAVVKDVAERRADLTEATEEQLDTIRMNAERHLVTYPNSAQARGNAAILYKE